MRRIRNLAVDAVSRAPARVQTKLLVAFLLMVVLLIGLGAVGLRVLGGLSQQTEELIELQRKIAAFRQVQHNTTSQLYGVSSALLAPDERVLDGILRQLSQFGYDLDRLQYVAQDEAMLMARVREEYDRFIEIVAAVVELARAGQVEEARELQRAEAGPLAERLERLTNQLVNVAEAAMLERIAASQAAYSTSRTVVAAFALGSIVLALGLGYVFSWSLVGPITSIEARLRQIASGDFSPRVEVTNRDELGALANNVNRTSEELGRLYRQIEERTQELSDALERQTATSEVLGVISRSTAELQPVLDTIVATAARLCHAEWAVIFKLEADDRYHLAAASASDDELVRYLAQNPVVPGRGTIAGRAALQGATVHVPDVLQDPEFTWFEAQAKGGHRTVLGVPLLRGDAVIGVIGLARNIVQPFTDKEIGLVTTFADQAVIAIENVRLFEEVKARTDELTEALERQTATSEVLGVISRSTSDLQPVLDTIVVTAARLCDAEWAHIFRLEADGRYQLAASLGDEAFARFSAQNPPVPGRGRLAGRVVLEGRTVHIPDVLEDPEYTWHEAQAIGGFRTVLGVPLLRGAAVIGIIILARNVVRPFTDKEIELVTTFADQAVIAIENVRLFDEVQARNRDLRDALQQQTATADVLKVISRSAFDLTAVLQTLIESAARLCDAEKGTITRQIGERFYRAEAYGFSPEFMELVRTIPVEPERGSGSGRALLEGKVVHVPDVEADPEYTFTDVKKFDDFRTLLGVPMLREGVPIGVMVLTRSEVRPFTDKQIELVSTFADQAVIAIENVRLFDQVQARSRELTEALEQQTATSAILRVISTSPTEVQPVFETIVRNAVALCGSLFANVFRFDGEFLHFGASNNVGPSYVELLRAKYPMRPDSSQVSGRAVLTRSVVRLEDALADPDYDQRFPAAMGWRRMLGVPMLRRGEPLGVIVVGWAEAGPVPKTQEELLKQFADQAVIAIENARLFDEVTARTAELTEALERQTATADVLKVISRSALDLQTVMNALIESATRLCGATRGHIFRVDGQFLRFVAACGAWPGFTEYLERHPVRVGPGSVQGRAASERRTVHVHDVLLEPGYEYGDLLKQQEYRTVLAVPMLRDGALLGVITILKSNVEPFTDKQIELVTTFADQAVIAIENVRLFDEVQARTRELTRSVAELRALSEVSQAVNSTLELEAVLGAIAEHAVALAEADAGIFCAYDENAQVFRPQASHEMDPELLRVITERPVRLGVGAIGEAGLQHRAVQIPDIDQVPDYALYDIVRRPGYRALLAVPLLREDSLVGGLVLCRKTPGEFASETVELVQTLANQSVLAIHNAKLFHEIELKGQQLAAANRHKSEFLANMSHELRTPLNAVLGYAELIQDGIYGEVPEKIREVLDRVQQNGRHLLGLINDVLDLSKIEAGELKLTPVDYSIRELVLDVASAAEALAKEKRLELRIDAPAGLPPGRGDERRITQVLMNLVGNAIKFTEAGSVTISAAVDDDRFLVSVADTGPGIAEADQQRIFAEFQQVDSSSTRKKGGTGLGLAIARRIVELHGGRIWVESTPGQGATFRFTLPLAPEQVVAA